MMTLFCFIVCLSGIDSLKIERKLKGSGFHRIMAIEISLSEFSKENNFGNDFEIKIKQNISKELIFDLFAFKKMAKNGKKCANFDVKIERFGAKDIEAPSFLITENSVEFSTKISRKMVRFVHSDFAKKSLKLDFPISFRYLSPSNLSFVAVKIPNPEIFVKKAKPNFQNFQVLEVLVPTGKVIDRLFVIWATFSIVILSTLIVICAIFSK
ncbi:hypothetical protein MHBO_002519 [Bonamia ostreae]|uniref:Dolichyl-diphosphooligosaccharide--protein glycosyltransferase subunit 1 n=1 Tax=Bonamia ostreae TaxID=126728 RepID=A0ABV2AML8_9EUKA